MPLQTNGGNGNDRQQCVNNYLINIKDFWPSSKNAVTVCPLLSSMNVYLLRKTTLCFHFNKFRIFLRVYLCVCHFLCVCYFATVCASLQWIFHYEKKAFPSSSSLKITHSCSMIPILRVLHYFYDSFIFT